MRNLILVKCLCWMCVPPLLCCHHHPHALVCLHCRSGDNPLPMYLHTWGRSIFWFSICNWLSLIGCWVAYRTFNTIHPIVPVSAQGIPILYGGFNTRRYTLVQWFLLLLSVSYRVYRAKFPSGRSYTCNYHWVFEPSSVDMLSAMRGLKLFRVYK